MPPRRQNVYKLPVCRNRREDTRRLRNRKNLENKNMIDNESEGKEEMNSDRDKMIVYTQHLMAHCNPRRSKFGLCLMYLGIIVALACIGYILFGGSRNNWWIILLLICLPISLLCGGFLIVWAPVESGKHRRKRRVQNRVLGSEDIQRLQRNHGRDM